MSVESFECVTQQMHTQEAVQLYIYIVFHSLHLHVSVTPVTIFRVSYNRNTRSTIEMRWRGWLRHCATNRKVAGSIHDGVTGICQ